MKTFVEVYQSRHFGRAAQNLYVTQAAVSARIKQLESRLGEALFIRQRNNLQLTAAGDRLLPHAQILLQAWSQALQDVALPAQQEQLTLASTPALWHFFLNDRFTRLREAHGDIAWRAEAHPQPDLLQQLLEGLLDLVLTHEPLHTSELQTRALQPWTLSLLSDRRDTTLEQALGGHYIYVDWGTAFGLFHAKRFGDVVPSMHTNLGGIAETTIRQRGGSAYLPASLLDSTGATALFRVDGAPDYERDLYAAYRGSHPLRERIETMVQTLE